MQCTFLCCIKTITFFVLHFSIFIFNRFIFSHFSHCFRFCWRKNYTDFCQHPSQKSAFPWVQSRALYSAILCHIEYVHGPLQQQILKNGEMRKNTRINIYGICTRKFIRFCYYTPKEMSKSDQPHRSKMHGRPTTVEDLNQKTLPHSSGYQLSNEQDSVFQFHPFSSTQLQHSKNPVKSPSLYSFTAVTMLVGWETGSQGHPASKLSCTRQSLKLLLPETSGRPGLTWSDLWKNWLEK